MTLRPDLAFLPLDDELVVFSEASQSLVGLNPTAAFIVRKLREDTPVSALASVLVSEAGATAEDAAGWVATTLQALGSQGLLADGQPPAAPPTASSAIEETLARRRAKMPPHEPFEAQAEGRYRLLETFALIRYAHPAQKRLVDSVIGHLKSDEDTAPTLVIDIQAVLLNDGHLFSNIYCDGKPDAQAAKLSKLGPLVKSALWVAAVNAHDFLLDLHAGVVGKGGRCILLPAAAGSGKSSLTAALTHSGFGYFSDEVALIDRGTFQVSPVPLAVCVKSTGWEVMSRYYPEIPTLPTHLRDDGKVVRYVPPRAAAVQKTPAPVSHIFFPRYIKGEPTKLKPLARSDALARLMEECLVLRHRLDQDNARELVRWIATIDCYALSFSSLDEAVALVESTFNQK
jgi:Coenzyme PQQ synthesis protein D (PqqD)